MRIIVDIKGNKEVSLRILEMPTKVNQYGKEAIFQGVNDIRNEIILSMTNTIRAPWSYPRTQDGRVHHPSLPEHPPARDYGWLVEHIIIDNRDDELEVGAEITDPPYPFYLEFGTENMDMRPWLWPAKENVWPDIERNILDSVRKGID